MRIVWSNADLKISKTDIACDGCRYGVFPVRASEKKPGTLYCLPRDQDVRHNQLCGRFRPLDPKQKD
jgi:hypothetical protein